MNQQDLPHATDAQPASHEAADGSTPHECEFCSPEPQIMPDPWDVDSRDAHESKD